MLERLHPDQPLWKAVMCCPADAPARLQSFCLASVLCLVKICPHNPPAPICRPFTTTLPLGTLVSNKQLRHWLSALHYRLTCCSSFSPPPAPRMLPFVCCCCSLAASGSLLSSASPVAHLPFPVLGLWSLCWVDIILWINTMLINEPVGSLLQYIKTHLP